MENTLLVALSRQMSLERQIDIIANNVANTNTNGFKANKSLFEEYLNTGAHEDNFSVRDRRVSFVQDRAAYHDFTQGPAEKTGNPLDVSIDGKGFIAVQTPQGERYTRDGSFQINAQGQLVTTGGNIVLGTNGPIIKLYLADYPLYLAGEECIAAVEQAPEKYLPQPVTPLSAR
jgi:flagellar basal-body rod protein FlgF